MYHPAKYDKMVFKVGTPIVHKVNSMLNILLTFSERIERTNVIKNHVFERRKRLIN